MKPFIQKSAFLKIIYFIFLISPRAEELKTLLDKAYQNNLALLASESAIKAENSLVRSQATLGDPIIGISNLNRGTSTQYATITQKIQFPIKYALKGKIQRQKVNSLRAHLKMEKLNIREKVISLYYSIYSLQKMIQLIEINKQAVKEFARVAEKKYAAGKSTQGDSMKAHFELTQLELDFIRLSQEEIGLQEELKAILNDNGLKKLNLYKKNLSIPEFKEKKISDSLTELKETLKQNSPQLKKEIHLLSEAEIRKLLSRMEFIPDFQFQYQHRISGEPKDAKMYSFSFTMPLWFWKKSSEASAALSYKVAQEYRVANVSQTLISKIRDLKNKALSGLKILKIYKTSLIPQAQGAYSSTRASYRANKTSFLDLLDSERSLYRVKTGFYQSLRLYVQSIVQLESYLGVMVSNFKENTGVLK